MGPPNGPHGPHTKIIECLRQINFVKLEDSVPKWKIGYENGNVREIYKAFNVDTDDRKSPFCNKNTDLDHFRAR